MNPLDVAGDILVLAGDILYLGQEAHIKHPFWDWCSDNFRMTFVVPGNHEFYGGFDVLQCNDGFVLDVRNNVRYINNQVVTIDGIDFAFSTLWANIRIENAFETEQCISDFRRIVCGGERLTVPMFNSLHEHSVEYLKKSVRESQASRKVVVSHHLPSNLLVAARFRGSRLNGAFVSEQSAWIADSGIDYWIYGHSHSNIDDNIGPTLCLTNQLGYIGQSCRPSSGFDRGKVITIPLSK